MDEIYFFTNKNFKMINKLTTIHDIAMKILSISAVIYFISRFIYFTI